MVYPVIAFRYVSFRINSAMCVRVQADFLLREEAVVDDATEVIDLAPPAAQLADADDASAEETVQAAPVDIPPLPPVPDDVD